MPADSPTELFVGLEGGVGTLALQFDDNQRNEESKKLAEHIVERHKYAHPHFWEHVSSQYPQNDGDDDAR